MDPHCVREGPRFLDLCAAVLSPPESPERTNFYVPHLCLYMIIYFKLSYISEPKSWPCEIFKKYVAQHSILFNFLLNCMILFLNVIFQSIWRCP